MEPRLRDLLRANATIVERLDLETVLHRIVHAAVAMLDARSGTLRVLASDGGGPERIIRGGIDGVDGGHPPRTDASLGIPVCVGDEVYATLTVTRAADDAFTAVDEQLMIALAYTAGVAIQHARLYDSAKTREIWSASSAEVMAAMLEVSDDSVLDVITQHVAVVIGVDLAVIAVPNDEGHLRITAAHGPDAAFQLGSIFPPHGASRNRSSDRARSGRAARELDQTPAEWRPGTGPSLTIALSSGVEQLGILAISRAKGAPAFTDTDLDMAFAFASQASVAIEVVRARSDRRQLDTSRDHARIARDLHDHVIQTLFAAGISLQAASTTMDADASTQIEEQVDVIDAAIREVRAVVFALGAGERGTTKPARERMLDAVAELSAGLSATPRITFTGPLDSLVSATLAEDLVAVLRECLTNASKHAHAHTVDIEIGIVDGLVTVVVEDDGRGTPQNAHLAGLADLRERARLRGGELGLTSRADGGTRVEWSARMDRSTEAPS